jgi:hypothetical protein
MKVLPLKDGHGQPEVNAGESGYHVSQNDGSNDEKPQIVFHIKLIIVIY